MLCPYLRCWSSLNLYAVQVALQPNLSAPKSSTEGNLELTGLIQA